MPAHHAKRPPLVVANARHSPLWLRFAPRSGAFWRAVLAHPKNSQPLSTPLASPATHCNPARCFGSPKYRSCPLKTPGNYIQQLSVTALCEPKASASAVLAAGTSRDIFSDPPIPPRGSPGFVQQTVQIADSGDLAKIIRNQWSVFFGILAACPDIDCAMRRSQ